MRAVFRAAALLVSLLVLFPAVARAQAHFDGTAAFPASGSPATCITSERPTSPRI
jgi:hypothetical protein